MIVICESQKENYNAGPKAPRDVSNILSTKYNCEVKSFFVNTSKKKSRILSFIKKNFFCLTFNSDDIILVQMPFLRTKVFERFVERNKVVLLIHDLVGLRYDDIRKENAEISIYKKAFKIISHNENMTKYLIDRGVNADNIVNLELFDYLTNDFECKKKSCFDSTIVYAGNLNLKKAPFIEYLDKINMNFNLYGIGFQKENSSKIKYLGAFSPEKLPSVMVGDLGLVWDGEPNQVDSTYGVKKYTKYNNPHKVSCYIAAGIPVIVWREAAIASFVKKNNIGYCIEELNDINKLNFLDYNEKLQNVKVISEKVRNGYYLEAAIEKILKDDENV